MAEEKNIYSEILRQDINRQTEEAEKPLDKTAPAVWRPANGFKFSTTRGTYKFLTHLEKYQAAALMYRIAVLGESWVDLTLDDAELKAASIKQTVEHLRGLLSEGEVNIEAAVLCFDSGQHLLDYMHDLKIELKHDEVEQ
ncbi:MAG: hypothetical protein GY862_11940 [Gammaproteobacteria bacterium]|nr:hypothetical protein [Gammaproteobacteria bacterium]